MFHFKTKRVNTGRKIEKKKFFFIPVRTGPELANSKINAKKFKKNKKHHLGIISRRTGQDRRKNRDKKKIHSYPFKPDPS